MSSANEVIRRHLPERLSPEGPIHNCGCGGLRMGEFWSDHLLAALRAEGFELVEGPHPDPCGVCAGTGNVFDDGYYVPGEQYVEPPFWARCEACVGTGAREVRELTVALGRALTRVASLENAAALEKLRSAVAGYEKT